MESRLSDSRYNRFDYQLHIIHPKQNEIHMGGLLVIKTKNLCYVCLDLIMNL
jgi:hypothetical protein